jgi:hypothetical protein
MSSLDKVLGEIKKEFGNLKKELGDLRKDVALIKKIQKTDEEKLDLMVESINRIHIISSDLSCKLDLTTSSMNIQTAKPAVKKTKSSDKEPAKKMNIMSYCKAKYKEGIAAFNNIITEEDVAELFEKHSAELKTKKKANLESTKANLIYKELIRKNDKKLDMLKSMQKKEEEELEFARSQREMIEQDLDDEDGLKSYDEDDEEKSD